MTFLNHSVPSQSLVSKPVRTAGSDSANHLNPKLLGNGICGVIKETVLNLISIF